MNWGQEDLFPANLDLADILGDMYFEVAYFVDFWISQISRCLDLPLPKNPHGRPAGGRMDGRADGRTGRKGGRP